MNKLAVCRYLCAGIFFRLFVKIFVTLDPLSFIDAHVPPDDCVGFVSKYLTKFQLSCLIHKG